MVTIYFEGKLAKKVGEGSMQLRIRTVKESLAAMNANIDGFYDTLCQCGDEYTVLIDGKMAKSQFCLSKKVFKSIHFIPILVGGAFFTPMITALAVTLGVKFFTATLIYVGTTLALMVGVYFLLSKLNDIPDTEDAIKTTGFLFGGAENTASQGGIVPVGYGRLKIGSKIISASLSSVDKNLLMEDTYVNNKNQNSTAIPTIDGLFIKT